MIYWELNILTLFLNLAQIIGVTLIGATFIELAARVILYFTNVAIDDAGITRGTLLDKEFAHPDSYTKDDWYITYCIEAKHIFANFKWQPLGLWSAPLFQGKYINIDKGNIRRTIVSKTYESEQKVYCFGGSTMWGWGARDNATIPSHLASLLASSSVYNFAQLGYVSSQELISFVQLIKQGNRPDVVVFLDGLNDMYSAYQSGIAGIEQNAVTRKSKFESKGKISTFDIYQKHSSFIKLISSRKKEKNVKHEACATEDSSLASCVIEAYNQNVKFITTICDFYNIKSIFIWQPTLFDKTSLTEYEKELVPIVSNWRPLYLEVINLIRNEHALDRNVVDLSSLFVNELKPTFIDPWHYNEHTNLVIAKKIANVIKTSTSSRQIEMSTMA